MPVAIRAGVIPAPHSLDIAEPQILFGPPDDPLPYHHRILVHRIRGSRWVVATPTARDDIDSVDAFSEFPAACLPIFGISPISQNELRGLRAAAATLDVLLGGVPPPPSSAAGHWLYSDTAHPQFGKEVAMGSIDAPTSFVRGSLCIFTAVADDGSTDETFAERVRDVDRDLWL